MDKDALVTKQRVSGSNSSSNDGSGGSHVGAAHRKIALAGYQVRSQSTGKRTIRASYSVRLEYYCENCRTRSIYGSSSSHRCR